MRVPMAAVDEVAMSTVLFLLGLAYARLELYRASNGGLIPMSADEASARIYADPRLAREHRHICRLIVTILKWRGVPEDEAKRQAEALLRPAPRRRRRSGCRAGQTESISFRHALVTVPSWSCNGFCAIVILAKVA